MVNQLRLVHLQVNPRRLFLCSFLSFCFGLAAWCQTEPIDGPTPIDPEPTPNRSRNVPCRQNTFLGSTVNVWDWRQEDYTISYYPSNQTEPETRMIDSPFHEDNFNFSPNISYFSFFNDPSEELDYQVEDGWELLYQNLGTPDEPVEEPSFGMYNRYNATVRIFWYIEPNGESTYQTVRLASKHHIPGSGYNVSAMFEHLNLPMNAIDNFEHTNLEYSQLNEAFAGSSWYILEYVAAYDPCVCQHTSAIENSPILSNVSSLNFTLDGTGTSEAIYPSPSSSGGLPFGVALDYGSGFASALSSGAKFYKKFSNYIDDESSKKIPVLASVLPNWFPAAGGIAKVLNFLVGGGSTKAPPLLAGFNHDFSFTGEGDISTDQPYAPIRFYTPGAFYDEGDPMISPAVYDNPLGIFAVLETPIVEQATYDFSTQQNERGEMEDLSERYFRFTGNFKYVVNRIAGINETPIQVLGSLVFLNTNTEELVATPLIDIECLPDFSIYGRYHQILEYANGGLQETIDDYGWNDNEGWFNREPLLQIVVTLENSLNPDANEIIYSALYNVELVPIDISEIQSNAFEGLSEEEIMEMCVGVSVPNPATHLELSNFCRNNYDPAIQFVDSGKEGEKKMIRSTGNTNLTSAVEVFPSPFKDHFTITTKETWTNKDIQVDILDQLGRVVWTKQISVRRAGQITMAGGVGELPPGSYSAIIKGEGINDSFKLIKQ